MAEVFTAEVAFVAAADLVEALTVADLDAVGSAVTAGSMAAVDSEATQAVASTVAVDFMVAATVAVDSTAVAVGPTAVEGTAVEGTAAGTTKLSFAEDQLTTSTADGSSRRPFSFSISCESSRRIF
jgi:hypothetical protein